MARSSEQGSDGPPDDESRAWLSGLRGEGRVREEALGRLHELLLQELDRYVEAQLGGAHPDAVVPGLRAHLDGCPACAEDHASLLAFVAARSEPPSGQLVDN